MRRISLQPGADLEGFRAALRRLIAEDVPPQDVIWNDRPGLFAENEAGDAAPVALPR